MNQMVGRVGIERTNVSYSDAEILECIRNLCGLRAMQKDGDEDRYPLREKVIFFADGHVPP
jgi:hypothetical protein